MISTFRSGVQNLRVTSHLFSFTIVIVALSTFVVVMAPMLEQVAAVEEFGVYRRSWVAVHIDANLSPSVRASVETELLSLSGVDEIADSTKREVGLVVASEPPESDLENYRTLGLDGSVDPDKVASEAAAVPGVDASYPRFALPPESNHAFYEQILPMLTLIALGVAMLLVVRLAFLAARTKRHRELGLLATWVRHGAVVVLPVVLTIVGASCLGALLWPPLVGPVVSSLASGLISGGPILEVGLELALDALFVVSFLTFVAMASERPGKHTARP